MEPLWLTLEASLAKLVSGAANRVFCFAAGYVFISAGELRAMFGTQFGRRDFHAE